MDPHALSAPFAVDPAYSADTVRPSADGLSLLAGYAGGPGWLYLRGDVALHLFHRMRCEAFATCRYVYHPGRFRHPAPTVYATRSLSLDALPDAVDFELVCACQAVLLVNGQQMHVTVPSAEARVHAIGIRPWLKVGENTLRLVLQGQGEPATFLVRGNLLHSDAQWQVSADAIHWAAPECFPAVGPLNLPHRENLPAVPLTARPLGDGLYDFGVQTFGRPAIEVSGEGPLAIRVGESVEEAMATDPAAREQVLAPLAADGRRREGAADLALRYLKVDCPPGLRVKSVSLAAPLYPACYRGAFACSDDRLTAIWMRAAYTLRLCMRWLCVDGLKRDRLPWGGDLYMSGLVNNYVFADPHLIPRSLVALYGHGPAVMDVNDIVDYTLFWVLALRDTFMHTGDRAFLEHAQPLLTRLMDALAARADADGFLPSRPHDWVFIDWSTVDKQGVCAAIQMLHVMALDAAAELYRWLDLDAAPLLARARRLRRRCHRAFWSPGRAAYVDNCLDGHQGERVSRPTNIFAVLSGVAGRARSRELLRTVFANDAIPPVGTPYMRTFESLALARCGQAAAMLGLIHSDWGGMMDAGATTFWEGYDAKETGVDRYAFYGRPFAKSLCHAWSAGPAYLLSQGLTGARPVAPGWTRFTLAPLNPGLDWYAVAVPCPQGAIQVTVKGRDVTVAIPAGATYVDPRGGEHAGPDELAFRLGRR